MKEDSSISQQMGRKIPIRMQKAVYSEIKRFLKEGHIERVDEIKDHVFIQPTVITVKKDRSVKIALDARALNKAIVVDKYQMPNWENLMEIIAERLDISNGEVWYSSVDLTVKSRYMQKRQNIVLFKLLAVNQRAHTDL